MIVTFPNYKFKTFTLSYDDGTLQDRRLTEILRKYNLKATFNINSGLFDTKAIINHYGFEVNLSRISEDEVADLYNGFEVAVHTLTHPNLTILSDQQLENEVLGDKNNLETLTRQNISGLAYPGGTFNNTLARKLEQMGIKYARTIENQYNFSIPEDFLMWHPTCHDNDEQLDSLTEHFIAYNGQELQLFYVWGHSFELDKNDKDRWANIDRFCSTISGREDIWYATNMDICNYINASKGLKKQGDYIVNTSDIDIYLIIDNNKTILKGHSQLVGDFSEIL